MLDLLGFQPQCSDIKLQCLHEEALYMTFNCCHDLRGRITGQNFHFVHRARNHRLEDLPQSSGIIDRRGVRRELLAYIRDAAGRCLDLAITSIQNRMAVKWIEAI